VFVVFKDNFSANIVRTMANIHRFKSYFLVSITFLFVVAGCFKPSPPDPEEQAEKITENLGDRKDCSS